MNRKKKTITFNIFTYNKDFPCLIQCLTSIRRLKGCKRSKIFVWDDANFPLTKEQVESLKPYKIEYNKTFFNRNKNLNGLNCVIGMLICLEHSRRYSNADYIFKVDCDSYLNRINFYVDYLKNGYDMVGTALVNSSNYAAGCCYALNGQIINKLIENHRKLLDFSTETLKEAPHLPEDLSITELVRLCNGKVFLNHCDRNTPPNTWELAPFKYSEYHNNYISPLCLARYRFYSVANFGNRFELDSMDEFKDKEQHQIAGECMKKYADFIEKSVDY